jgi:hypothetical protein
VSSEEIMRELLSVVPEDLFAVSSPLDAVVAAGVQRVFLDGGRFPISSSRSCATVRSRRLHRLAGASCYEVVLEFLAHYVALVLPDPVATEGSFWAVEAIEDAAVEPEAPRQLVRVSVHGVPVATVVEDPDGDGELPVVCLALAPMPVVDPVYCPEPAYLDVGGTPVSARLGHGTADELTAQLLGDPDLLLAARRAVLGLMRLGPVAGSCHHRDVATTVFAAITAAEALTSPGAWE